MNLSGTHSVGSGDSLDPVWSAKRQAAEAILNQFEHTALQVQRADNEKETIDLGLMREIFSLSFQGQLRDAKFFSDLNAGQLRPELRVVFDLLNSIYPESRARTYVFNWINGSHFEANNIPYDLTVEVGQALKVRYRGSLEHAGQILVNDSVLERLVDVSECGQLIALAIRADSDSEKERHLEDLRREIIRHSTKLIRPSILIHLLPKPAAVVGELLKSNKVRSNQECRESWKLAEGQGKLSVALQSHPEITRATKQFFGLPLDSAGTHTFESVTEEVLEKLMNHVSRKSLKVIEAGMEVLIGLLVGEVVKHRIRKLNVIFRNLKELLVDTLSPDSQVNLQKIKTKAQNVLEIEAVSARHVERRLELSQTVHAEFTYDVTDVIKTIDLPDRIEKNRLHRASFRPVLVGTSGDMFELLEGLRVQRHCLSYDFPWGESHFAIPELLFSASTDTLLLQDVNRDVLASLTVRLMPAVINGRLEPVLYRQKMRVRDGNDIHRLFLNEAAVQLAVRTGATRIVAPSGFIGDPHAIGYNSKWFTEGLVVEYSDLGGRLVREHVKLTHRRRYLACSLKFIRPEAVHSDGFHSHDNKHEYPPGKSTILGFEGKIFTDPEDRSNDQREAHLGYWVVDLIRTTIPG